MTQSPQCMQRHRHQDWTPPPTPNFPYRLANNYPSRVVRNTLTNAVMQSWNLPWYTLHYISNLSSMIPHPPPTHFKLCIETLLLLLQQQNTWLVLLCWWDDHFVLSITTSYYYISSGRWLSNWCSKDNEPSKSCPVPAVPLWVHTSLVVIMSFVGGAMVLLSWSMYVTASTGRVSIQCQSIIRSHHN